ncbi:Ser [Echinococcus multilocularis]|uniref:Ser n=1 Tax=Echinococcus multilocularis TaxID=6211 RepID=A0A0S4MM17_ECHMU|nr:Ser [Echinococcus multilocularis]
MATANEPDVGEQSSCLSEDIYQDVSTLGGTTKPGRFESIRVEAVTSYVASLLCVVPGLLLFPSSPYHTDPSCLFRVGCKPRDRINKQFTLERPDEALRWTNLCANFLVFPLSGQLTTH